MKTIIEKFDVLNLVSLLYLIYLTDYLLFINGTRCTQILLKLRTICMEMCRLSIVHRFEC